MASRDVDHRPGETLPSEIRYLWSSVHCNTCTQLHYFSISLIHVIRFQTLIFSTQDRFDFIMFSLGMTFCAPTLYSLTNVLSNAVNLFMVICWTLINLSFVILLSYLISLKTQSTLSYDAITCHKSTLLPKKLYLPAPHQGQCLWKSYDSSGNHEGNARKGVCFHNISLVNF